MLDLSRDSLEAAEFRGSSGAAVSRSFITNKPHKAHDAAWEAIRSAATATTTTATGNDGGPSRSDRGYIGVDHFRFLQRLGGGDIGHVYLTELVGHERPRPRRGNNSNGCIVSTSSATRSYGRHNTIAPPCYFAMKIMDKHALRKRNKLHRARTEREILETLDHPFLPTLYAHIDDHRYSCLVMEFCPGGDLHVLRQLQPGKRFREEAARFYAAEVLMALEYLHMMGVVYRDLKPENVLVREDGHIMLSDFDLSLKCTVNPTLNLMTRANGGGCGGDPRRYLEQEGWGSPAVAAAAAPNGGLCSSTNRSTATSSCVEPLGCITMPPPPYCSIHPITSCLPIRRLLPSSRPRKGGGKNQNVRWIEPPEPLPELLAEPTGARSMSFVGTHEYLAPEIILGQGHGAAVDWWTLGIFLYELLYSRTPFKGGDNEATLTNVVTQLLKFPAATARCRYTNGSAHPISLHEGEAEEDSTPSMEAQDLIRGLLVKDPSKRMGAAKGATEVKQHSFFRGVNWALIRCATPPEIPSPFIVAATATAKESGHGHNLTHSAVAVAAGSGQVHRDQLEDELGEEDRLDSKWKEDSDNDNGNTSGDKDADDDDDDMDYGNGHFMNGGRAATPEFEFF